MGSIWDSSLYSGTRAGLKFMGQWPFQSPGRNKFLKCMWILFVGSIYLPKFIKFVESLNDVDLVMECMPMLCCHGIGIIKFINWAINTEQMKHLLVKIERDWESLKLQRDIDLLIVFTDRGRKINRIYAILGVYLVSPGMPKILDLLLPRNESRPRIFLYQTEYFIDQDKYYMHILIHAYLTVPVSVTSIVYFDNLFAMFINHTCGMCEILKRHLEDLCDKTTSDNRTTGYYERIKLCATLQTNIIQFIEDLESSYSVALFLIVGLNMWLITLTGMMGVVKINEPSEVIRFTVFNGGAIFHLFWSSWQGHNLIVQTESVFISAYQNEWYRIPWKFQKMMLPFMMRSITPCRITAGKFYYMSMDSFGVAMRMTMSFFTLLLSVQ
ncbi:odorant receptor 13a-like isoform X2 [Diachasmimorpha longicaudata]|uniref:odorant receptor 13a-like isoform X2 n=1 Tax=Diachasmimorpha longicaudata TaxID=58733 RepID=UPI0030B8E8F0